LLLLLLPSSSSSSHLGIPFADPSLLSGAAGSSILVIHAGIAEPIPLPFGLGLIVVDGGGIVIYVSPPKAYPLMSVVFAIVAPHSPSLEYEIPRVDGAPGTHVPECRVGTVRASVVVIEHPHTISSSSLMRQTSRPVP
jgi:hypothetical protein